MTERYNYGYIEPAADDWRAAFDSAPACHHPSPTFEVIKTENLPDIALDTMARIATSHLEDEIILVEEIDALTDDPEAGEQE